MRNKSLILILLMATSISSAKAQSNQVLTYKQEIDNWHSKRVESLTSESGWLTVAGLFWLKEGENPAGSSKENKIVLPKNKAAEKVGVFILKAGEVSFTVLPGIDVKLNSSPFTSGVIFNDKTEEQSLILEHKNLRLFIIKRGEKYGIRMRDLDNEARKTFTHIDRYDVTESWKITATFEAPSALKTIPVVNVIGLTTETPFGGTLRFERNGKKYQVDATLEDDQLFIVFSDETAGVTTYGGGRFLYAKLPKEGSNAVLLDFNKAYNPPCAFTDFATCPLPPDQNKLALEINAGEKIYERH
jgi:uncharacterized protein